MIVRRRFALDADGVCHGEDVTLGRGAGPRLAVRQYHRGGFDAAIGCLVVVFFRFCERGALVCADSFSICWAQGGELVCRHEALALPSLSVHGKVSHGSVSVITDFVRHFAVLSSVQVSRARVSSRRL